MKNDCCGRAMFPEDEEDLSTLGGRKGTFSTRRWKERGAVCLRVEQIKLLLTQVESSNKTTIACGIGKENYK